jgi:hypothetical protein
MPVQLFGIQRTVGEELLAADWHASSIAIASKPGSAWVLFDPTRRVRVRMCSDLADVVAEVTTTRPPGGRTQSAPWTLAVHDAPVTALVTALLAAPDTCSRVSVRNGRAIVHALAAAGMRPDRSRLARALSGTTDWFSADRSAEVTWTAPHRARVGGWQILTPAVHLNATPGTPAAVLAPLIAAVSQAAEGRTNRASNAAASRI